MLGISTCWRSKGAANGEILLDELAATGLDAIELEYRITTALFNGMRPLLEKGFIKIASIHNYFPLPSDFLPESASGDLFNLAGEDPDERRLALEFTTRTLETANDLGVERVVIHLGYVEGLEPLNKKWASDFQEGREQARKVLEKNLQDRAARAHRALDRVKFNLDKLLARALRLNVVMGLENRDWPREIPNIDEMGDLLRTFEGAPLGFWYDVGHAAKQEFFGLSPAQEWPERYGPKMVGAHVHDFKGIRDHLPPGKGDLDFASILSQIRAAEVRILEIGPHASKDEVQQGIRHILSLEKEMHAETLHEKSANMD